MVRFHLQPFEPQRHKDTNVMCHDHMYLNLSNRLIPDVSARLAQECRFESCCPELLFYLLRDGATGSTMVFEIRDEGSNPSPAANSRALTANSSFERFKLSCIISTDTDVSTLAKNTSNVTNLDEDLLRRT